MQPPPSVGVPGIVLETWSAVKEKDGVGYKEVALMDLRTGEVTYLFDCPTSKHNSPPQVFAWIDPSDSGESGSDSAIVSNSYWFE